jgi:uncharacterized alpha-E superfamily protein
MSEGVLRFYHLAEVCRDRAAQTRNSIDADAWLKLAEDWLELAHGQRRDTPTSRAASDQRRPEDLAARVLPQVCPR